MGDKELMWALKNGDLDEVKTLLKKVRERAGGGDEHKRGELSCVFSNNNNANNNDDASNNAETGPSPQVSCARL